MLQRVETIFERSTVLKEMKESDAIDVVGGMYDVASGAVEFLPNHQ